MGISRPPKNKTKGKLHVAVLRNMKEDALILTMILVVGSSYIFFYGSVAVWNSRFYSNCWRNALRKQVEDLLFFLSLKTFYISTAMHFFTKCFRTLLFKASTVVHDSSCFVHSSWGDFYLLGGAGVEDIFLTRLTNEKYWLTEVEDRLTRLMLEWQVKMAVRNNIQKKTTYIYAACCG